MLTHSQIILLVFFSLFYVTNPYHKQQQTLWRLECELGVVTDSECPLDGGWSAWEPWSPCRGSCDSIGHRRRKRHCTNPPPSDDGLPCQGPEEEIQQCHKTNCTVEDFRRLMKRDALRMEAFHQLELVPSLMERCLQMECPYETLEAALSNSNFWQANPERAWNALQCVKHNIGCPVIGEWGSWGGWSACRALCGHGLRWRVRSCDTPPPSHAHFICSGTPLQAVECEGHLCAVDVQNTEHESGPWNPWSKWSACSENCGNGVRRRQRTCRENYEPRVARSMETYCIGLQEQFGVCVNDECTMDGGWSAWSTWGPCSQTCGAGRKSRTRSCTRPVRTGNGLLCIGRKTEFTSCYLSPCEVYSHKVAFLNGYSYLQYDFKNKRSTLFHFYARFMSFSPHGTLVRRGIASNPLIRLSIQKWHLCLDARGTSKSCTISRICTPSAIEPAAWHNALVAVTSEDVTLRLDNVMPLRAIFSCDPELPNENVNVFIGEKLHGQIQELAVNFIPLSLLLGNRHIRGDFHPSSTSNVIYEKGDLKEGYLEILNDYYLRMSCLSEVNDWFLELTLKPKRESGTLLFMRNEACKNWLHVSLQNMRLRLKISLGEYRAESMSSTECSPNEWLDVRLTKRRETGAIEAFINAGERLHVVIDEGKIKKLRMLQIQSETIARDFNVFLIGKEQYDNPNTARGQHDKPLLFLLCKDEFFLGGVPAEIMHTINDFNPFYGTIASISINGEMQDLQAISMERYKDDTLQLSSKTASVSGSYHEISWGKSNRLNLTCLHARAARPPREAIWLFLETEVVGVIKDKNVRSVDDGKVLRLAASADNYLRGFYTCRAYTFKRSRNVVTYGVIGQIKLDFVRPDIITAIAMFTTMTLVLTTLGWLVLEGINDLRCGYGFFRDTHLSPEEETDAVCGYIDNHLDAIGARGAAELAKVRARRRGRQLMLKNSFDPQEPQGLLHIENVSSSAVKRKKAGTSSLSELDVLPEIPILSLGSLHSATSPDVYRFEQSFVSSPLHGSNMTSARTNLESSSSFEMSPRVLCSRKMLAKRLPFRKSRSSRRLDSKGMPRSDLLTIKSSTFVQQSPVHKILEKFRQLRNDDDL